MEVVTVMTTYAGNEIHTRYKIATCIMVNIFLCKITDKREERRGARAIDKARGFSLI